MFRFFCNTCGFNLHGKRVVPNLCCSCGLVVDAEEKDETEFTEQIDLFNLE